MPEDKSLDKSSDKPYVAFEEAAYIVAYKPARIHCAPLKAGEGGTLVDWCAALFPEIPAVRGRKPVEGGLVHRLDFETRGLVLFARTQEAFDHVAREQEAGRFVKEYTACSAKQNVPGLLPGFPPPPPLPEMLNGPFTVASGFRPFGEGRKTVRPVSVLSAAKKEKALDRGGPYTTEILEKNDAEDAVFFKLRLNRGFRHQIRCHLAWLGFPITGDTLYGGVNAGDGEGRIALCAAALAFGSRRYAMAQSYDTRMDR